MTQEEREYYEQFVTLDTTPEILKALRIDNMRDEGDYNYDEVYQILDRLDSDLDSDIFEARKNIMISYNVIERLKDNLINMVRLQEGEEDEEMKSKYDDIISNGIHSADAMFNQIQEIVSDLDVAKDTKRFINELRKHI